MMKAVIANGVGTAVGIIIARLCWLAFTGEIQ